MIQSCFSVLVRELADDGSWHKRELADDGSWPTFFQECIFSLIQLKRVMLVQFCKLVVETQLRVMWNRVFRILSMLYMCMGLVWPMMAVCHDSSSVERTTNSAPL